MKPLHNLNNVDRVNLLVSLFPMHKIEICRSIIDVSNEVNKNYLKLKVDWNTPVSLDMWKDLGDKLAAIVIKYDGGKKLKTPGIFADQLADGYLALFTIHCICEVAAKRVNDKKFTHCCEMLFSI